MRKSVFAGAMIFGILAASNSYAQQAPAQGLSGDTPDCQATVGQPILLVRNLIEGTMLTGLYAKPLSSYSSTTHSFLSVGSLFGGQVNLLPRPLKGKKLDDILGTDDDNPGRCGFPVNFGNFAYRKDCSQDKFENLYQMTAYLKRGEQEYTVTLTKNVCDETMLDIVPGIPPDDADKHPAGQGLSASTTPTATPDCETTAGQPLLLVRNLIEGTVITGIRARPFSDYDRGSKTFLTTAKGVDILHDPVTKKSRTIPGKALNTVLGTARGRCGLPINFGQYDFRTDCSPNKIDNIYEMTINLERGGQKYTVALTRNVCDETMVDIAPGIPANKQQ